MFKLSNLKPFGVMIEPSQEGLSISDLNTEILRDLFNEYQLILMRGFKTFDENKDFEDYCDSWGDVSLWPFGKILELIERENPEDHIFDNNYVPLHWDGMYREQVPEYQIFHCAKAPIKGQGGCTTFSNTILALDNADENTKKLWKKVTGIYKRNMEYYNSKVVSPIITKHPFKECDVIRYNEPPSMNTENFLNPPDLNFSGVDKSELNLFHKSINDALYAPSNFYAHEWQEGDVVIADNFSLLHGREKFVSKTPRHLQRIHVLSNPPLDNVAMESYQ
jgi:alpha-ketoglutarate-dependent taurine dioxygenase